MLKKIFKIFSLGSLGLVLFFNLMLPIAVLAEDSPDAYIGTDQAEVKTQDPIKLNIPIGNVKEVKNLGEYVSLWYKFTISMVGILATVMIMWHGFKWLNSRGNSGSISDAKDGIFSAIIGLVLAFLSFTILSIINPGLLNVGIKMDDINKISQDIAGQNNKIPESTDAGVGIGPNGEHDGSNIMTDSLFLQEVEKAYKASGGSDWNEYLKAYIKTNEGLSLIVYKDSLQNPTIGYGHMLNGTEGIGTTILITKAEELFTKDLNIAFTTATDFVGRNTFMQLPKEKQMVLVDMAFNMGTRLNGFTKLRSAIQSGNFAQASIEITDSIYAKLVPNRARRNAEQMAKNLF